MAFHSIKDLSVNEKPTAVIFGFLSTLLRHQAKLNGDNWIFTWDSKNSYRKKLYPEYKAKRNKDKTDEEIADLKIAFSQFTELRKEILPELGFKNVFMRTGFEADDLMAEAVKNKKYNKDEFIIVSTDQDLYQLLNKRVRIYAGATKGILTEEWFALKYNMPPFKWAMVKAMGGCSSDNIPGMSGIGEKTAIDWYSYNKDIPKGKKYEKIISKEGFETRQFFKKLTTLPFNKKGKNNTVSFEEQKLYKKDFINVFDEYKMISLLKKKAFNKWVDCFNLK